jgi:hypothetical protein
MKKTIQPKKGDWCVAYGSVHGDAVGWGEITEWRAQKEGGYGRIINPEIKELRDIFISETDSNMKLFSSKKKAKKEYRNNSFIEE